LDYFAKKSRFRGENGRRIREVGMAKEIEIERAREGEIEK
jgi:hypothetical protein